MTVWIVNPFDNLPTEGYRPLRFWLMAEAFVRAGHEVTYWTSDFSHANKAPRRILPDVPPPPFRVVTLHEPPYARNVSLRRLWAHWRWAKAWTKAAAAEAAPDLIVVSTPPLAVGGAVRRYAARRGTKVIVDVMDDWPGTFERVAPRWALAPLRAVARRNCRAADAVTVVSDRYADLARSYGFSGPVRRFYHGIALPPAPKAGGDATAASALRLLYLGNLGRSYDLSTVVEALALLPGATLDVAGEGEQVPALEALAERAAPGRVRFHGYVGRAALAELLSTSDVGIVPMAPDSCVGIPYKFADYSSFGLAIVSSLGGESGRLLARYGAGAAYRGGDPQNLAASLRALAPKLAEARTGSRRLAETEFDADAIYAAYVRFATDLVK